MLLQHQINPSSPDYTDFQFVKYVALNATQYSVFQNTPYAKRDARYVRTHYGTVQVPSDIVPISFHLPS